MAAGRTDGPGPAACSVGRGKCEPLRPDQNCARVEVSAGHAPLAASPGVPRSRCHGATPERPRQLSVQLFKSSHNPNPNPVRKIVDRFAKQQAALQLEWTLNTYSWGNALVGAGKDKQRYYSYAFHRGDPLIHEERPTVYSLSLLD